MSRCIALILCSVFLLVLPLSQSLSADAWEIGLRNGSGFRVPGRFDSNLNSFSSSFNPAIISDTNLSGGSETATYEGLVRFLLDRQSKVGFIIGRQDLSNLVLTEVSSDFFLTKLNSKIFSYHVFGTYHFVTDISHNWELENGLGMGFASADWQIEGLSAGGSPNQSVFQQKGHLRGSGLGYRAETSINRRLGDNNYLQIGLGYHHIAIANFSGNYNGEGSSFYIRTDGKVGVFDDSRVLDISVSSEQYLRRLDMSTGSWNLYFSVLHRFLD